MANTKAQLVGTNVRAEVNGTTLTITVDLSAKGTQSKSGKSLLVASTSGFTPVGPGLKLNLNVTRPTQ